jgi:hypothetical protein
MCGDTACWSCGPAQGSPSCEYSRERCGDPECPCATSKEHHDPAPDETAAYAEALEADAALADEYRDVIHSR